MVGINYRKHSQCLEEFEKLNKSGEQEKEKIFRGWPTALGEEVHQTEQGLGGLSKRDTPQTIRQTKLLVERSSHLTPVPC